MKTFKLRSNGREYVAALQGFLMGSLGEFGLDLIVHEPDNGDVEDPEAWERWATLTTTAYPDYYVQWNEFIVKTYGENEGILEQLEAQGLVERTGQMLTIGLAGPQPVCRLTDEGKVCCVSWGESPNPPLDDDQNDPH